MFSGVRSSCDTVARNSLFAAFARVDSAASRNAAKRYESSSWAPMIVITACEASANQP
jgi:hypothetical protein